MAQCAVSAAVEVDLAILGAGCAGLSVAQCLSREPRWLKTTALLEARSAYQHDRSWCFWEPQEPELRRALASLITHRWSNWQFSGQDFSVLQRAAGREYCYVPSDRFYQQALACITSHPRMQLYRGCTVETVTALASGYRVQLSDGTNLIAGEIIDTRPSRYTSSAQATLWQIIYGFEIRSPTPVFNTNRVGLMEELTAAASGTQFGYVLPFSTQHALVEWTAFSAQLLAPESLAPQLQAYLRSNYPEVALQIIRVEQAVLPMGLHCLPHQRCSLPKYQYGGQVAGAIRPATGYAFLRIQRWARKCAAQLSHGFSQPVSIQSGWLTRNMDQLFLAILQHHPEKGAAFFQALSERVAPQVLVRFLSDEASVLDCIQVMRALPGRFFLRHVFACN